MGSSTTKLAGAPAGAPARRKFFYSLRGPLRKKLDKSVNIRNQIADRYNDIFNGETIKTQMKISNILHAYHLFIVQVEERKELYNYLHNKNIFPQVHYIPVHTLPYYQSKGWKWGDFPIAENFYNHCLSLPMYPSLEEDEQSYVINTVMEFIENH